MTKLSVTPVTKKYQGKGSSLHAHPSSLVHGCSLHLFKSIPSPLPGIESASLDNFWTVVYCMLYTWIMLNDRNSDWMPVEIFKFEIKDSFARSTCGESLTHNLFYYLRKRFWLKCLCDRNHLYLNMVNEIINILQEPMYIAIRPRSATKGKRQYVPRDQVSSWPSLYSQPFIREKAAFLTKSLLNRFSAS